MKIGMFYFGKLKTNCHGTQVSPAPWNKEMVRGPKFVVVKIGYIGHHSGRRLIFYFPNGSWWHFDVTWRAR
jgi:hypothetical protein